MNTTPGAPADPPAQPTTPGSPPPPADVDITEPLRWAASVASFVGYPDSIEFHAHERHVRVTLRNETLLTLWARTIGATPSGRVQDALGVMSWARTPDDTRWRVTLCAVAQDGGQR